MAAIQTTTSLNIGFLTVLHEANGYVGGYLVTNQWGRPLEFRLSTAVQPNRVQQILYGGTLQPYICSDLIGKTLIEKTATPVQMVLTETESALDVRLGLELPVGLVMRDEGYNRLGSAADCSNVCSVSKRREKILCHPRFPNDTVTIRGLLNRLDDTLELAEPFARIREAIVEARKMGVTGRLAG